MDRLSAYRPARTDALAALAFALLWFGAIWTGVHLGWWYPSPRWSWRLAGVFTVGVLLFREVRPREVFWCATLLFAALYGWFNRDRYFVTGLISEFHLLPIVLAAYTVTARGRLKTWVVLLTAWVATAVVFVSYQGVASTYSGDWRYARANFDLSGLAVLEVAVAAIVLAGRASFRQAKASQSARRRNELLRRAETEQVVTAERTRIARELHDLVAHHISAVVIRAQAADRVADARPEELREAVRWIAANGQETLTAMRHVVRVLRSAEQGADLTPQATLAELPEIATRMEAVGLPVSLVVPEKLEPMPAAVELAAVRIVQEALTNVLVHARATRAVVEVHPGADTIRLEIHDDGIAGAPPTEPIRVGTKPQAAKLAVRLQPSRKGGGHGLIGMRERATSTGGSLRIGTSPLGGWMITAVLGIHLNDLRRVTP